MKKILFYVCGCLCILLVSCTDEEIVTAPRVNNSGARAISTSEECSPADSLERKYQLQSDVNLMLSDRIVHQEGHFALDLTLEEAKELSISAEIYQKFVRMVDKLNESDVVE